MAPEEELVIWVPARLLLCASKDADLAQHLTETLLKSGLLPAKVPLASAARQWAAIYMSSTPQVRRPGAGGVQNYCAPCSAVQMAASFLVSTLQTTCH